MNDDAGRRSLAALVDLAPWLGPRAESRGDGVPSGLDRLAIELWQVAPHLLGPSSDRCDGERPQLRLARDLADLAELTARLQDDELGRLGARLDEEGIRHAWMKGSAVRRWTGLRRVGRDLDLAVWPEELERAERLLLEAGYSAADWNPRMREFVRPDLERRRLVEAEHYELGYLVRPVELSPQRVSVDLVSRVAAVCSLPWTVRSGRAVLFLVVDAHHGINPAVSTRRLLRDAVRLDGLCLADRSWSIALAVYKLYWEGVQRFGRGAHQCADVAALVATASPAEHARALEIVIELGLSAGAAYVLRRLPSLGVPLSAPLAAHVEAMAEPLPGADLGPNDLGDHWPRIWGRRWL